jgi:hypothetical protein
MSEQPKENEYNQNKKLTLIVWITIGLFFLLEFVIANVFRIDGKNLIDNSLCFKYLGCNVGFFGYDALVHFTAGIFEAPLIIWLFEKYYHISLFHNAGSHTFWKNLIILIALLVLIAYSWEIIELSYDQFRIIFLHQILFIPDHLNKLLQPSNIDTMGDIFCSTMGGIIGGFISRWTNANIF